MWLAERDRLTKLTLNERLAPKVAGVMARKVATADGFAEDIASALAAGIESDPRARRSLVTSALSSHTLREALIQKLVRELR